MRAAVYCIFLAKSNKLYSERPFSGESKTDSVVGKQKLTIMSKNTILQDFRNAACSAMSASELGRDNQMIDYTEAYYRVSMIYDANVIGG